MLHAMEVPFSPPDIREEDIADVLEVLRSGWITTGDKTRQFQKMLQSYTGAAGCVCLSSATAALFLALKLLDIGPGDEVITSVYTYAATLNAILYTGATPILVDTEEDSYNISPAEVSKRISQNTKAVIAVDVGGRMCDYPALVQAVGVRVKASGNPIIEALGRPAIIADAAHSLGAMRDGIRSGNAADMSCFSFHAVKNLTTAEGGALCWRRIEGVDNAWILRQLSLLSLHGQNKSAYDKTMGGEVLYDIELVGYKCNMPDVLAALGISQLRRYRDTLKQRKQLCYLYDLNLRSLPRPRPCPEDGTSRSSRHLYMLTLPRADIGKRNLLLQFMREQKVVCNVHYTPLHRFTAYQSLGYTDTDFPHSVEHFAREISLPLSTALSREQIEYTSECLISGVEAVYEKEITTHEG